MYHDHRNFGFCHDGSGIAAKQRLALVTFVIGPCDQHVGTCLRAFFEECPPNIATAFKGMDLRLDAALCEIDPKLFGRRRVLDPPGGQDRDPVGALDQRHR